MLAKASKGFLYPKSVQTLFAGAIPRTISFGIGGFIFFGVYERALALLES